MSDKGSDNILGSLKTLFWGAFVGVVSFQVLAPNIWGFLDENLAIPKTATYKYFTILYFLAMPLTVLVWIYYNRKMVRHFLPEYKRHLSAGGKMFFWAIIAFLLFQVLMVTLFSRHWENGHFFAVQVVNALFSAGLLLICFLFCKQRIRAIFDESHIDTGDSTTLQQELGEEKVRLRQIAEESSLKLFVPALLIYLIFFVVTWQHISIWLKKKDDSSIRARKSYEAGLKSFALQSLNGAITSQQAKLSHWQDSVRKDQFKQNLDTIARSGKLITLSMQRDTVVNAVYLNYFNKLRSWEDEFRKQVLDALMTNPDTVDFQFLQNYASTHPLSLSLADTAPASATDTAFLQVVQMEMGSMSSEVLASARELMGAQLRSSQSKGLLSLVGLFFGLVSLFIFLRVIEKTQSLEKQWLDSSAALVKEAAKTGDGTALVKQDVLDDSKDVLNNDLELTSLASERLWLFITIVAWLMVPIFKPFNDSDINLAQPYKKLTLAEPLAGSRFGSDQGSSGGKKDTVSLLHRHRHEPITIRVETPTGMDSAQLNMILKDIQKKVDDIDRQFKN